MEKMQLSKLNEMWTSRCVNKNSLNDSTESGIKREEAHLVTINKEKKVVVTGDSLLNGISGFLENHQVTVKNVTSATSKKY